MRSRLPVVILLAALSGASHADIYKCLDPSGQPTYTNQRPTPGDRNCVLMSRDQPVTSVPAPGRPAAATSSPATFPRVSNETQKTRDDDRRKILEQELETELKALEGARKELAEQEATRLGNERNYQKYLDRVQTYKDKVALHERNAEAIRKEIANLK